MRVILIGRIHEQYLSLMVEKAYTKKGFSNERYDVDLRYLCSIDQENLNRGVHSERLSFRYRPYEYRGMRVAVLFDASTDIEIDNRCFFLKGYTGKIIEFPFDDESSAYFDFDDYLSDNLEIELGNGTKVGGISDYIREVYLRTKDFVSADGFRYIRYDFDNYPTRDNYESIAVQGCYLCKYSYAYFYMYLDCYRRLLSDRYGIKSINVLSLGCGSKLDGYGLLAANHIGNRIHVEYHGVDYSDWEKNGLSLKICDNDFTLCPIEDYLENNDINSDVVIFPHSLSELSKEVGTLGKIAKSLATKAKRDYYLVFNIRESSYSAEFDENTINELISLISANPQRNVKDICLCESVDYSESNQYINEELPVYPSEVLEHLQSINSETNNSFHSLPALKKKYIKYQIYKVNLMDKEHV